MLNHLRLLWFRMLILMPSLQQHKESEIPLEHPPPPTTTATAIRVARTIVDCRNYKNEDEVGRQRLGTNSRTCIVRQRSSLCTHRPGGKSDRDAGSQRVYSTSRHSPDHQAPAKFPSPVKNLVRRRNCWRATGFNILSELPASCGHHEIGQSLPGHCYQTIARGAPCFDFLVG